MSERKNIERLFQEKFKDFEETPSPKVWENIQSKLEKKENKRRVVPFWLKASGIAAVMVLGFFTVDYYNDVTPSGPFEKNTETVVSTESSDKNNNPIESVNSVDNNSNVSSQNAAASNIKSENNTNSLVYDKAKDNKTLNQNNAVVVGNKSNSSSKSFNTSPASSDKNSNDNANSLVYDKAKNNKTLNQNKAVVVGNKSNSSSKSFNTSLTSSDKNKSIADEKNKYSTSNPSLVSSEKMNNDEMSSSNKNQNSKRTNPKKQFHPNPTNGFAAISPFKKLEEEKSNTPPAKENQISPVYNDNGNQKEFVVQNSTSEKIKAEGNSTQNLNKENETNNNLINSSQNNAIANGVNPSKVSTEKISKDSIVVAVAEENPLDKILKEKQEPKKQEILVAEKTSQWKIRPNVAPIFMNAAKGSPIDEQFADNTKDFENNLSVGLGVDFALNSKISIRTGIHKFEMAYNTNDIEYYADLNGSRSSGSSLETINREPEARMIVVADKNVITPEQFSVQELAVQSTNEGYLNQKIGYIEVPFEMSYKLIDRKFGVELISGLSTLFLNENEVSVVSEGLTTVLGEANNLNKIHFSANIGVGFKYNFWKSFEANFEPTFKYQMNSFNANAGGFKPYLIGLYTGLSFKF